MRPTLEEQLRGLRDILTTSVAPAVAGDYPRETLAGVVRALEMLEARVATVGPFLVWDNEATRTLLRELGAGAAADAPETYAGALAGADVAALDAENERLRGLLAATIPSLTGDAHTAVVTHLRERIARYPYSTTGSLPAR